MINIDITSAAIATVIATITSTIVTLFLNRNKYKRELDNQLDSILKLALQYPYLENKEFTNNWSSKYDLSDEKASRYEIYATLVYNYLSRFTEFYNFNVKKIEKHLAVKDWVRIHGKYWYDPTVPNENIDVYDLEFRKLVEDYLAGGNAK
jgi:hypothetical protein